MRSALRRDSGSRLGLEIVIGIVIGPAVLGWVEDDEPVEVLSLVGLALVFPLVALGLLGRSERPGDAAGAPVVS